MDDTKPEVTKLRLFFDLDVVRGNRWRELAPFREAVLFHFTPPALREQIVLLSEALADRILEDVTEAPTFGEPGWRAHLRAVMADLEHDGAGLREFVAAYSGEMIAPNDREILRLSLRLAEALERTLTELSGLIGPAPSKEITDPEPERQYLTERKEFG